MPEGLVVRLNQSSATRKTYRTNWELVMIKKLINFISEAKIELKKVSWTPMKELLSATWVVIISVIIITVYIFVVSSLLDVFINGFLSL